MKRTETFTNETINGIESVAVEYDDRNESAVTITAGRDAVNSISLRGSVVIQSVIDALTRALAARS